MKKDLIDGLISANQIELKTGNVTWYRKAEMLNVNKTVSTIKGIFSVWDWVHSTFDLVGRFFSLTWIWRGKFGRFLKTKGKFPHAPSRTTDSLAFAQSVCLWNGTFLRNPTSATISEMGQPTVTQLPFFRRKFSQNEVGEGRWRYHRITLQPSLQRKKGFFVPGLPVSW